MNFADLPTAIDAITINPSNVLILPGTFSIDAMTKSLPGPSIEYMSHNKVYPTKANNPVNNPELMDFHIFTGQTLLIDFITDKAVENNVTATNNSNLLVMRLASISINSVITTNTNTNINTRSMKVFMIYY